MNFRDRLTSDTPKFFRVIRNVGLGLTAASAAILTLPASFPLIVLPAILVNAAGYMAAVGSVASVVSQLVYKSEDENNAQ